MQIITASRLHAFRKCKRYHRLRYLDGWQAAQAGEPITFGRMVHSGLEAFWRGTDAPQMQADDPVLGVKAEEILRAYTRAWSDRDEYAVVAVEIPHRWPLLNPDTFQPSRTFEMGGVIDLLLKRKATGEIILVEHKTTGSDFSDDSADYWRRLAMDSQLSIYVVAAESLGYRVDRIIYDVIARPMLRLHKATPLESRKHTKDGKLYANQREADESLEDFRARLRADIDERPERYYGRREIARTESEVKDGMLDIWQEAKAIREAEVSGRHPRNPDACHQMGTCEMYDICAYGVEPEHSALYQRRDDPHPELTRAGLPQETRA